MNKAVAASAIDWGSVQRSLRSAFKTPQEARKKLLEPLLRLVPATCVVDKEGVLQPRLSRYITEVIAKGRGNPPLKDPTEQQRRFLMLDCEDAYYGGAAGGGKSLALLMAFAQFADVPGYNGLVLRRTFAELKMSGALLDLANSWWYGLPGVTRHEGTVFEFATFAGASSSRLTFGYLENENDKLRYQSANFHFIGVDEVTMFSEADITFMFSRLRRAADNPIPLRFRSASNPNGPGRLWVKGRYVDPTTRGNRVFVPATINDNHYLDRETYKSNLSRNLGPVEAAQLLHGDWDAQASGKFKRQWFKLARLPPVGLRCARYWDLAATEPAPGKDPSWTVGVLVGELNGQYYVVDVRRDRLTPRGVEELIKQTAAVDGSSVAIRIEQEPGSAGVRVISDYAAILAGYDFSGDKVTGPKELRTNGFASQAEAGNVFMVAGEWNKDFLDEHEVFPRGGHDDIVVATSGAFNSLTELKPIDTSMIMLLGNERPRPDW